jgi:hypothetical protein
MMNQDWCQLDNLFDLFQVDVDEGSSQHNERQLGANKHLMDIGRKIRVDPNLDLQKSKELWQLLEKFANVFAWNKSKLGCRFMGKHYIDTQGIFCLVELFLIGCHFGKNLNSINRFNH